MQVALDDWAGYLQNDELLAFAAPMLTLMLDDHEERDGVLMTPEKRADCIPLLPHLLVALHACVRLEQVGKRKTRKTEPYETLPVRTTPKIGRNAPCPCGSGKKYKRCCGSPTNSIN